MKRFAFAGAIAALAATFALAAAPVEAAGVYTNGFPQVTAANIQSTFQVPADTQYAGGAAPQTAYVTTGDLKTYANGGAIVTATGSAGASTAAGERVVITTEALSTAAGATFTETITNSAVTAASLPLCSVWYGTATTGTPTIARTQPGAGTLTVLVQNIHASAALNGTIVIGCRISS
jgi:hypothetical protein